MTDIPHVDIDPFSAGFLEDPYPHHHALRDAGPVVWLPAIDAFGMARYAEVKAALADHQTYCSGRGVGLSDFAKETPFRPASLLLETDPPVHDRTRGLMNKIVSLSALRARREQWQATADSLLTRLVEKRTFDAVSELSEAFPMQAFPETIGLQHQGREHLLTYATSVFNAFGPRNAIFDEGQRGAIEAIEWVTDSCRRKNLLPGGWGMAVFEAVDSGECTEAEAERLVRSFLSAGVDTTVNGIGHMVLAFATYPPWRVTLLPKAPRSCYSWRPRIGIRGIGRTPRGLIRPARTRGTSDSDSASINVWVKWWPVKKPRLSWVRSSQESAPYGLRGLQSVDSTTPYTRCIRFPWK
jgi:cytochrome P450